MKSISAFCLICIFLCGISSLSGNDSIREDDLFYKADSLYKAGNYFEAAIAYERVYFFSEEPLVRVKANLWKARSLKQNGEFIKARNDLQRSLNVRSDTDLHFEVMYEMALCDYLADNYSSSLSMLRQIGFLYSNLPGMDDVIFLESLAYIMTENWESAMDNTLEIIQKKGKSSQYADSLTMVASLLFCECNQPRLRSEKRAGNLSTFVPGLGQVYAGYPVKGAVNAASQLVSLGIAAMMVYHRLYISGFVMGLGMFQSFYFGGVKQASYLAHQKNLELMLEYKTTLKDFLILLEN